MTDTRALAGGVCLALGGIPLAAYYGTNPLGAVGLSLIVVGSTISYGAYQHG